MRSIINSVGIAALSAYITTTLSANIPLLPLPQAYDIFPRGHAHAQSRNNHAAKAAVLKKPAIKPAFSEDAQDRDLRSEMPTHQWHYEEWNDYWIPEYCLEEAEYNKLSGDDFDVRTVWYDDCAAPWVVCRHRLARESWENILTTFSQVPVGMRQYLANLVIMPTFSGSSNSELETAAAYTRGVIMVFSPSYFTLGVLFHEFAHILDSLALPIYVVASPKSGSGRRTQGTTTTTTTTTTFSSTRIWQAAYDKDTHVPTKYARESMRENFADVGRWAMSDMVHSGGSQHGTGNNGSSSNPVGLGTIGAGLQSYSAGWEGFQHQVWAFRKFLGPVIFTPTGKCTGKVRTSRPVSVPAAMERVMMAGSPGVGQMPNLEDVPVDGDEEGFVVEEIFVPEEEDHEDDRNDYLFGVHVFAGEVPKVLK